MTKQRRRHHAGTPREHLGNLIAELARRGMIVTEDAARKTVTFELPAQMVATAPDEKLLSLSTAAHRVELEFLRMGYVINDPEYTEQLRADAQRGGYAKV